MARAFTGKGDDGATHLWRGVRVPKTDARICAVGDLDEANAALGLAASLTDNDAVRNAISYMQNALFSAGAELSGGPQAPQRITKEHVAAIEHHIADLDNGLAELHSFILPTGNPATTSLHLARAVMRRAERSAKSAGAGTNLLSFLNRSSSLLFVAARRLLKENGLEEQNPNY